MLYYNVMTGSPPEPRALPDHAHAHPHAHGGDHAHVHVHVLEGRPHPHRRVGVSLLRMSALQRLAVAGAAVACVWLAVLWALR